MSEPRSKTNLLVDQCGAVFVEFLFVIVPLWLAFLCLAQLALFAQADLIVKRAADAAARSASVVLPDDPNYYGGEPQMSIERHRLDPHESTGAKPDALTAWSDLESDEYAHRFLGHTSGRSRLDVIRSAAYVPLTPLAPHSLVGGSWTLRTALASRRGAFNSRLHHPASVAVTFPQERDGRIVDPAITVRVSYAYGCAVPIARAILCSSVRDLASPDFETMAIPSLEALAPGRFRRIQHESTVLIQSAPYEYRPRSES